MEKTYRNALVQSPGFNLPRSLLLERGAGPEITCFPKWSGARERVIAAILSGETRVIVTGQPGTGKTALLQDAARMLRAAGWDAAVSLPTLSIADTLGRVAHAKTSSALIIDEADRLAPEDLKLVLATEGRAVLLAGLPILGACASGSISVTLSALTPAESREFVALWAERAGPPAICIEEDAVTRAAELSLGVPRVLAKLLSGAVWIARSLGSTVISRATLEAAAKLQDCLLGTGEPLEPEARTSENLIPETSVSETPVPATPAAVAPKPVSSHGEATRPIRPAFTELLLSDKRLAAPAPSVRPQHIVPVGLPANLYESGPNAAVTPTGMAFVGQPPTRRRTARLAKAAIAVAAMGVVGLGAAQNSAEFDVTSLRIALGSIRHIAVGRADPLLSTPAQPLGEFASSDLPAEDATPVRVSTTVLETPASETGEGGDEWTTADPVDPPTPTAEPVEYRTSQISPLDEAASGAAPETMSPPEAPPSAVLSGQPPIEETAGIAESHSAPSVAEPSGDTPTISEQPSPETPGISAAEAASTADASPTAEALVPDSVDGAQQAPAAPAEEPAQAASSEASPPVLVDADRPTDPQRLEPEVRSAADPVASDPATTGTAANEPVPVSPAPETAALPRTMPTTVPAAVSPSAPARPPATPASPLSKAVVDLLINRGDQMLQRGDISAARLLYGRAAAAGSSLGALSMGRTYDPAFLSEVGARIVPDQAAAAEWYRRAAALGSSDALQMLPKLEMRSPP